MTEEGWKELRQRFIDRREMLNMSQSEVAQRAGMAQTTVSSLEAGRTGPPAHKTIIKWARALRMTARVGVVLTCPEYREPYVVDITPED